MAYDNRDTNEPEVIDALERTGHCVERLNPTRKGGVPDLLVGRIKLNLPMEVKHEKGQLNALQVVWHDNWNLYGYCVTIWTPEGAIAAFTEYAKMMGRL